MATTPYYVGDRALGSSRPCAAPVDEFGTCEDAARRIGVQWTLVPSRGVYGWTCSAHDRLLAERYNPEQIAAQQAQLGAEGRAFWATYGEESGETPRVSQRDRELDSLNSDI